MGALQDAFQSNDFIVVEKPTQSSLVGYKGLFTRYVNDEKGIGIVGYCLQSGGYGIYIATGNNYQLTTKTMQDITYFIGKKYFRYSEKELKQID
jgi:hypothetical protein